VEKNGKYVKIKRIFLGTKNTTLFTEFKTRRTKEKTISTNKKTDLMEKY